MDAVRTDDFIELLVPTDFSTGSRLAVDYALTLASRLGASVHLVHVVEDPSVAGLFTDAHVDMALIRKERRVEGRYRMNGLLAALQARRATDEIAAGPVAETIARIAAERGSSLIVMGTHGRTGLAHALVGSIAERVIRIASCPVLTVRQGLAGSAVLAAAQRREAAVSA